MENFPLAELIAFLAFVIAVWSLFASFEANRQSKKANKIGKKALRHSERVFKETNRPRVQLKPAVRDRIALHHRVDGGRVFFIPNIKIKNVGIAAAVEIECLEDDMTLFTPWENHHAGSSEEPGVASSLSPGQDFHLSRPLSMKPPEGLLPEVLRAWDNDDIFVEVSIQLSYKDSNGTESYSVAGSYRLSKNQDTIVDYMDS